MVDPTAETESPFEAAVEQALISKGYRVERQVGVAGYRIDLAILSEDGAKRELGIECDGWTYHSAPAARDRDWLRQKVLEGLGWKIHRVWSTAWVRNPEAELLRIEDALLATRGASAFGEAAKTEPSEPTNAPSISTHSDVETIASPPIEIRLELYERAQIPRPPKWAELRAETTAKLLDMVISIADVEGPVHQDVVIDRIRQCYGLGRVRGSTREHVERAIDIARRDLRVQGDGLFIWLRDDQILREPRKPVDVNIEHYPPYALGMIVIRTAKIMFGAARRDLLIESARTLGFSRTGGRIAEVIDSVIQGLLDEGRLGESFGNIHPTD